MLNFSYHTYFVATYYCPVVILILVVQLLVQVQAFFIALSCCLPAGGCIKSIIRRVRKIPLGNIVFSGVQLIYDYDLAKGGKDKETDDITRLLKDETKDEEAKTYTLSGRHLSSHGLFVLFCTVASILCCAAVGFWSEFLTEQSSVCDSEKDCFALDEDGPVSKYPLMDNCTDYDNGNYSIECFKFTFNYASAVSNAGGVLTLAKIIMRIQTGLWVGALSYLDNANGRGKIIIGILIGVKNAIVIVFAILIPLILGHIPLFDELFGTIRDSIRFMVYYYTFFLAYLTSGPLIILYTMKKKCNCNGEHLDIN